MNTESKPGFVARLKASRLPKILLNLGVAIAIAYGLVTYIGHVEKHQQQYRAIRHDGKIDKGDVAPVNDSAARIQKANEQREYRLMKAKLEKHLRGMELDHQFEAQYIPAPECVHPEEAVFEKCMADKLNARAAFGAANENPQ